MNLNKLKEIETEFLIRYPDGFETEELKKQGKKHNLSKHIDNIHNVCSKENLLKGLEVFDDVTKVVVRSSMVSVFEKVKFKDLIKEFDIHEKHEYLASVYEMLHGDEEEGFTRLVNLLGFYKLAKWPIITVYLAYYDVNYQVFVKPTTAKKIIKALELEDIKYSPKVNYEFYSKYRTYINDLKKRVDKRLQVVNPAFSAIFMITVA